MDRRAFLRRAGFAAAGVAVAGRLQAFGTRAMAAPSKPAFSPDYGPLVPAVDQSTGLALLKLPRGFEYMSFGYTGDTMTNGRPTPSSHDGMAAFRMPDGSVHLVRNHERGAGAAFASGMTYNLNAGGGTTTVAFDPDVGAYLGTSPSLAGTIRNCAGGPTPWGSWLSCEETTDIAGAYRHGYVFEVPADGTSDGVPVKQMGRFSHEAVAIDPETGIVYETEDATPAGFYRYLPDVPGDVHAGGRLQMLKIGDLTVQTYSDTGPRDYGQVSWVDIPIADPGPAEPSVAAQGIAAGGAQFERLEGAWHADAKVYFVSTSGGPARGQVFEFDPATERLQLIFHSPSNAVLDSPDNICISPRGGMVLCEDGSGTEFLHGLTRDGEIFQFAENACVLNGQHGITGDFRGSEWAGASFEPQAGNWLFANLQSPGVTFAITGPWKLGAL